MRAAAALLERGMAEPVIGRAPLRILEDVVGFVDFLEAVLAVAVARIAVGVPFIASLRKAVFSTPSSAVRSTSRTS